MFSFLGMFNIQKFGQALEMNEVALLTQMQILTEWYCWESSHTFGEPRNYCIDQDGKVKLIDYASPKAHAVIYRFGQRCYMEFSPQFKCTEVTDQQLMLACKEYNVYRRLRKEWRRRSESN